MKELAFKAIVLGVLFFGISPFLWHSLLLIVEHFATRGAQSNDELTWSETETSVTPIGWTQIFLPNSLALAFTVAISSVVLLTACGCFLFYSTLERRLSNHVQSFENDSKRTVTEPSTGESEK